MSRTYHIAPWKKAPFIRMLAPLISGIMLQWYLQFELKIIIVSLICFCIVFFLFSLLPLSLGFRWRSFHGVVINLLMISAGAWMAWQKDIRHHNDWYGHYYQDSSYVVASIDEPLQEKNKTYKAIVKIESIVVGDTAFACKGKLLCYFSKDSFSKLLQYGDKILLHKDLQPIKNSGNPGAFHFREYSAFHGLYHNVFLQKKDWIKLDSKNVDVFKQFLLNSKRSVLSILSKYCNSGKDELGIAEALLIGYTNDLDKDLVQAYSNTGVVHIIAISGMHLALIYLLLVMLFSRMPLIKRSKVSQVVLILTCLWMFSLLTGASASVLRSAVMFTFITIGKNFVRKSSIYNSLAASAFLLLCYDPYFLWDVGFQLSYLALIGIVMYQKKISALLFIKNKWMDQVWQLVSVSISAQVLTFPICIYYFHQFPLLFLLANLAAVPLSSIILYLEIGLISISWIHPAAIWLGKITSWLVWLMNKIITSIDQLSFAVWDQIPASILSTVILYAIVLCIGYWLLYKNKLFLKSSFLFTCLFVVHFALQSWVLSQQQKIIVYNVAKFRAVDIISGDDYQFVGDSMLLTDNNLQNFNLKPARVLYQVKQNLLPQLFQRGPYFEVNSKRILLIDSSYQFESTSKPVYIDATIISKNPKLSISQLAKVFDCQQYVFDASNSMWKIESWKRECSELHLRCFSVAEEGAFVFNTDE